MAISLIPAATAVSGTLPAANLPTGSVLQVVQSTLSTTFTATPSAWVYTDFGLSVSITPKFSTSKILVSFNIGACGTNGTSDMIFQIVRDSTAICNGTSSGTYPSTAAVRTLNSELASTPTMSYLDSPATTSSTTYKIQVGSSANIAINRRWADNTFNSFSTITVMEIAA